MSCLLPAAFALAGGSKSDQDHRPAASNYTDRLIVKMAPSSSAAKPSAPQSAAEAAAAAAQKGASIAAEMSKASGVAMVYSHENGVGATILKSSTRMTLVEASRAAAKMATQPGVEYAEPDVRMFTTLVPNDSQFSSQWALKSPSTGQYGINAQGAWDLTTGSPFIVVAVLDTGITDHVDLAGRTVPGYDFVSDTATANDGGGRDADPSDPGDWVTADEDASGYFAGCGYGNGTDMPSSWHGTHVAGTIGAASNNAAGIAGVNWTSKIQPIRVLGKCGGYTSDIADAITWASGGSVLGVPTNLTPARVISMSFGGTTPCPNSYREAIAGALLRGAVVIAAAGNEYGGAMGTAPANCPGVLAVSAIDSSGTRPLFSNYGAPVTIAAPGVDILSTLNTGRTTPVAAPAGSNYVGYSGTSMATPHVSAIASLMLSVRPTLLPHHIAAMIRGTSSAFPLGNSSDVNCQSVRCGDGIADATAAVTAAKNCTSPPTGIPAMMGEACNGDIDGDGVLSAATDGLLALRLAMGASGTSLTANALGSCATRTTYSQIRAYMNRNCGTLIP